MSTNCQHPEIYNNGVWETCADCSGIRLYEDGAPERSWTTSEEFLRNERFHHELIDAAVVDWVLTTENENDPRKLIMDIVKRNVEYALDPAVSEEAAKKEEYEGHLLTLLGHMGLFLGETTRILVRTNVDSVEMHQWLKKYSEFAMQALVVREETKKLYPELRSI